MRTRARSCARDGPRDGPAPPRSVDKDNKLAGSFQVLSGGMLDVDAAVYGPGGETHYSVQRQKSGTFQVMAPSAGFYKFCLSNKMSTITDKTVAFTLHTGDDLFRDIAKQGACHSAVLAGCGCFAATARRTSREAARRSLR